MKPFALLLLLLAPSSVHASDADHAVSQARRFVKNGWVDDAINELEKASATPSGRTSFDVHAMLANIHFDLGDVLLAKHYGERAVELATDPSQRSETSELLRFLDENFGTVHLTSPYPGMEAVLNVESAFPVLDPEVSRLYSVLKNRLSGKTALPLSVGLPVGVHQVNGLTVEVKAGRESALELTMEALGATGLSALQVSRIELATGVGVLTSSRVSNLRPSFDSQLSISQPIGPWIIGAQFDHSYRSFNIPGEGLFVDPLAYTVGLRVGREFSIGGPVAIRPSIGYRYGYVPGIALTCESADPNDAYASPYTCHDPDKADGDGDVRVYAIARTHIPFGELALDYRHSRKTTAIGLGIKVIGEMAVGSMKEQDKALVEATGETIDYRVVETELSAASVRMLANLSFAF